MTDSDLERVLLAIQSLDERIRRIEEALVPPPLSPEAQRVHDAIFGGRSRHR